MITITATCEGPAQHVQSLQVDLGMDWAIEYACLLDGSSSLYVHMPGPESPIGKCGICGAKIVCRISGRPAEAA